MKEIIIFTTDDYICFFVRVVAGIVIFPYGMQKLFGWFPPLGGGIGITETLANFKVKGIPSFVGWLVIIAQSFGSIALIVGFLGRVAAFGNFIIFAAAFFVHIPDGWTMNWTGKKKGEGIEYFILLLSLLIIVLIKGSGAWSIDYWLLSCQ